MNGSSQGKGQTAMSVVDRHTPGLLGLVAASFVIAIYRVLVLPMTGSAFWACLMYSAALMWPLLLGYAVIAGVERSVLGRRVAAGHPARQAALVVVPVFSIAFFATNGIASRLVLAVVSTLTAAITSGVAAAWFDSGGVLASARGVRRAVEALAVALLLVLFVPAGSPDDLSGLEALGRDGLPGRNIVVIAADGMDWSLLQRLVDEGELPRLARLVESGAAGPLHTIQPTSSPFIWNSVYTGFSPALHERRPIHYVISPSTSLGTFPTDYPDPARIVLQALKPSFRHPRAIWDSLTAAGYDSAVLGSWEQEPVPQLGRAFLSRSFEFSEYDDPRQVPQLERARAWVEPRIEPRLRTALVGADEVPSAEWERLLGKSFPLERIMGAKLRPREIDAVVESRLARLRSVYLTDRFRVEATKVLLDELGEPFFLFTYLMGLDTSQHSYTHQLRGVDDPSEPPEVVESYYRLVDEWVGEIESRIPDDSVLVIVSDHGIDVDVDTVVEEEVYKTGSHAHAPHGVLIVRGAGIPASTPLSAHVFDVAPTLLALAGIPNLAAVEGRVIAEVTRPTTLVADWRAMEPTTYEMGNPELADPELIERLRQLGYVR